MDKLEKDSIEKISKLEFKYSKEDEDLDKLIDIVGEFLKESGYAELSNVFTKKYYDNIWTW